MLRHQFGSRQVGTPSTAEVTRVDPDVVARLHLLAKAAAITVALLGATVLVGWVLDVSVLKSLSPNLSSMKPNAALAFIAIGLAVMAIAPTDGRAALLGRGFAVFAAMLGLATLAEYILGWNLRIDQLLFSEAASANTLYPGRMAPTTAACFVLLGLALLLVDGAPRWLTPLLSTLVMATAALAGLGYLYGASSLYQVPESNSMALHAAIGLLIASAAVLGLRGERAILVTSAGVGGTMVRRVVPMTVVVLMLVGEARNLGEQAGWYRSEVGVAIMVLASTVVLGAAVWFIARRLDRSDRERLEAGDALAMLNSDLENRIVERTAELAGSEERFRALAATASDAIVSADEHGSIVYANRATEEMFAHPAGSLVGQPLTILMPERFQDAHNAGFARYLATGDPHVIGTVVELAGRRHDTDDEFPLELSLSTWQSTDKRFFTGILRDITDKKRDEAAAQAETAALVLVAEAARAVAAADDLSAAVEAFGAIAHSVVEFDRLSVALHEGEGIFRIVGVWGPAGGRFPPGQRITVKGDRHWNAYRAGRPIRIEDTGADGAEPVDRELHSRGIRSYVSVPFIALGEVRTLVNFSSTRPHTFGPDTPKLFQAMVRDTAGTFNTLLLLDREREIGDRLRELDVLKNDFVGMVAHDLRAPMTVISGFASTLKSKWSALGDAERDDFLDRINTNIRRLSTLVDDVLEVARIESGEFTYEAVPFDLGGLARRTVNELIDLAPDRAIDVSSPELLPNAIGDELRTWRVLTNLISNAIKYSPSGSPINVTVTTTEDELQVAVRDHGPGIATADFTKLFQRFSRLPHAGDGKQACRVRTRPLHLQGPHRGPARPTMGR